MHLLFPNFFGGGEEVLYVIYRVLSKWMRAEMITE